MHDNIAITFPNLNYAYLFGRHDILGIREAMGAHLFDGEIGGSLRGVKLSAIYHDFSSDVGGTNFGGSATKK